MSSLPREKATVSFHHFHPLKVTVTMWNETYCCWQSTRLLRKCQSGACWEAAQLVSGGVVLGWVCLKPLIRISLGKVRAMFLNVNPWESTAPLTCIYWQKHLRKATILQTQNHSKVNVQYISKDASFYELQCPSSYVLWPYLQLHAKYDIFKFRVEG